MPVFVRPLIGLSQVANLVALAVPHVYIATLPPERDVSTPCQHGLLFLPASVLYNSLPRQNSRLSLGPIISGDGDVIEMRISQCPLRGRRRRSRWKPETLSICAQPLHV